MAAGRPEQGQVAVAAGEPRLEMFCQRQARPHLPAGAQAVNAPQGGLDFHILVLSGRGQSTRLQVERFGLAVACPAEQEVGDGQ